VSAVHHDAAVGFDRGAADYERGRPGYPDAAMELVARELGITPGQRVVDLAAGTGKLTRSLVGLGAELMAVEPVAGMREQLRRAVPGVDVRNGTAEQIPLEDATVNAVLVAQAFHWFDVPAAAAEIHRVLVPGGALAVIRNEWDRTVPWVDALQRLVREQPGHAPRHPSRDWQAQLQDTGLFTPLSERVLPNLLPGDLDTLLARVASLSFIAAMPAPPRQRLLAEVARLVDEEGITDPDGSLETPYLTHVMWCRPVEHR
jgi:SAM-dependent methyltransferase